MVDMSRLLADLVDTKKTKPPIEEMTSRNAATMEWVGKATAGIDQWNSVQCNHHFEGWARIVVDDRAERRYRNEAYDGMSAMLNRAIHDLRLKTDTTVTAAIAHGDVFDYFDTVRKLMQEAESELFFVDPYINADFVSMYLPIVPQGVNVRLLSSTKQQRLNTLLPSVQLFSKQHALSVSVRAISDGHDRWLFVDKKEGYQSGSSFKDGGKKNTTLSQISDVFDVVYNTYDDKWNNAVVHIGVDRGFGNYRTLRVFRHSGHSLRQARFVSKVPIAAIRLFAV